MKKLLNSYKDYLSHLGDLDAVLSWFVMTFSFVSFWILLDLSWVAWLIDDSVSIYTVLLAPIVAPLPLHLTHLGLFLFWHFTKDKGNTQ